MTRVPFEFNLAPHQYVWFEVRSDGSTETAICTGPEERDVYQRDVSNESSLEIPAERARSCPTHCCPKHGCKYGYEDCPVKNETVAPVYAHNNGCEICEDDLGETLRLIASSNELIDAISLVCSDAYQAGQGFRSWPWSSDDERGYIRRRLLESLDS